MRPELVGFTIVTIAVVAVGLLMLADRAGWRIQVPGLRLDRRWLVLMYVLLAVVTVLQALWLSGLL